MCECDGGGMLDLPFGFSGMLDLPLSGRILVTRRRCFGNIKWMPLWAREGARVDQSEPESEVEQMDSHHKWLRQ